MAASLFKLQELLYNAEGSFLQNATSPGSNTYAGRIPILSATCSLDQPRTDDETVQSRKNVRRPGFLGLRTGTLEFTTFWPGLDTDPAAASPAANWATTLMADGLGGSLLSDDGGTISSATDADTFVTTSVTALTTGSIIRVGIKGDGRADGQPGVVGAWAAGNTQLLTALPATPASPDAVRSCAVIYPTETNPATTYRFLFALTDSGAQFHCMGCQLDQLTFDIDMAGARPARVTWRYRVAYWDRTAVTTPSSVAMPECGTAPIAGGSLFVNAFATATRTIEECGSLQLDLSMGLIPQQGPRAGQESYGNITGWVSQGCQPTLTWSIPYTTQAATDFDFDGSSSLHKHALFVTNATAGRCQGFYLPRMFSVGSKPTYTNLNGLTYVTKTLAGTESTTTTTELTRSAVRFFMG